MISGFRLLILAETIAFGERLERELRRSRLEFTSRQAADPNAFSVALHDFVPELIVAQCAPPAWDCVVISEQVRTEAPHVPLILVVAAVDEEAAIGCLRANAADYVVQEHLGRLGPAAMRALEIERLHREQQRTEHALRENELLYRSLFESAPIGLGIADAHGNLVAFNDAMLKPGGYAPEDIRAMGNVGRLYFDPEERAQALALARKQGWLHRHEVRFRRQDGTAYPALLSLTPIQVKDRPGWQAMVEDLTGRKQAEETARTNERFLANVFASIQDGISILDLEYTIVAVNPTMERWYAHALPLVGKKCHLCYHQRAGVCDICPTRQTYQTSQAASEVVPLRDSSGSIVGWLELYSFPRLEADTGRMIGVIEYVRDITSRKAAEDQLLESEERNRYLFEHATEIIYCLGGEAGLLTELNPAFERITGWPAAEWLGRPLTDLIHPDDWLLAMELRRTTLRGTPSKPQELRLRIRSGAYFVGEFSTVPQIEHGRVVGEFGVVRDVTERRQAQQALRESEERFRSFTDAAFEGISISEQGVLLDASPHYAALFGYPLAEMVGQSVLEWTAPESRDQVAGKIHAGYEGPYEAIGLRKDGARFPMEIRARAFNYRGRSVRVAAVRDLTERLNLEAQLRHSQRMETVGQLAAGVAHDFNNVLTIIQGHTDLLLARPDADAPMRSDLQQISAAAARATNLTRQLLTFSRRQIMQPQVLDLTDVLSRFAQSMNRLIGEQITLRFAYAPALPPIFADEGMLEQIVINLVLNARDAMPKGGQLMLRTGVTDLTAAAPPRHPEAYPGRFVTLSIADTGCGMDDATRQRLFEPFFTTKEVGKGTGLGLATVYGIVRQHQGWIEVESQLEHGSTFTVFLPVTDKVTAPLERPRAESELRGGTETILVVEDEPALRNLVRAILQRHGYRVLDAESGVQALKVWDTHRDQIDLLFTDMVMPEGLTGHELAKRLQGEKPTLRVMYASGYTVDFQELGLALTDRGFFLQKPFLPTLLVRRVRECLDQPR